MVRVVSRIAGAGIGVGQRQQWLICRRAGDRRLRLPKAGAAIGDLGLGTGGKQGGEGDTKRK
jgi:hypothetical protein